LAAVQRQLTTIRQSERIDSRFHTATDIDGDGNRSAARWRFRRRIRITTEADVKNAGELLSQSLHLGLWFVKTGTSSLGLMRAH
jgi:hypothetical protein